MVMHYKFILYVFVVLVLQGCALHKLSYQPSGFSGGYSDEPLENGQHYVSFSGNGDVDLETVVDFAILRAAILAEQKQAPAFSLSEMDFNYDVLQVQGHGSFYKPYAKMVVTFKQTSAVDAFDTARTIKKIQAKYQLTEQQLMRKQDTK